jgi:spore germination protein
MSSSTIAKSLPRLSALQFATIVTSAYVALGLFYFPRQAVSVAHRDALWSIVLDGFVTFGLMQLMFRMNRLAPDQALSSLAPKLLGTLVAMPVGIFTIVYHWMLAVAAAVLFSFVLGNIFLPDTPIWAIDGAMVLTALYLAWHGTVGLARSIQAIYIPIALLTVLTMLVTASLVRYPILLLPSRHLAVLPTLLGARREYVLFIGFEVTVTLYPEVEASQRRKAERYATFGLGFVLLVFLIMYEIIMATFGPSLTAELRWPIVSLMRILSIQGFFIDKLGLLVIVLWTIVVTAFLSARLWCLSKDVTALFHLESAASYRLTLLVGALGVIVAAVLLPNSKIVDGLIERYLIPFGVLYLVAVPTLLLSVAAFRNRLLTKIRAESSQSST